jgi:hypothetical protein
MFHPNDRPMERGWVGRIDGGHVVHLAAQTLESYFTGGGSAREHAVYPLQVVRLLAPVLHPPSVRLFSGEDVFEFANPAAIVGPGATVRTPPSDTSQGSLDILPRLAAVIGPDEEIGGFTILGEWRAKGETAPKDRDFALALGPLVVTPDEFDPESGRMSVRVDDKPIESRRLDSFDWAGARALAASGTTLRPGDILGGPPLAAVNVPRGRPLELEVDGIGVLEASLDG